jgi:hypothetical protein
MWVMFGISAAESLMDGVLLSFYYKYESCYKSNTYDIR